MPPIIEIPFKYEPSEHFLTQSFRSAHRLEEEFNYDLSQLDKRDLVNFIRVAFEPEFLNLVVLLQIADIYIYKDLFHIFELFTDFVPYTENVASDYYCHGHIGLLRIQVCEDPLFDDDGILLASPSGRTYKTYIRGIKRPR